MSSPTTGTLAVAGACLYYEVRGRGPVLLVLQGGDGHAGSSTALADDLAAHYTVITYDRRGLSRSSLDESAAAVSLDTHTDDAHRLLAAMTSTPAVVVGFSIGALIGLGLAAQHPGQVEVLVAHEPPAFDLLADGERELAVSAHDDVVTTYQHDGVAAALSTMLATVGVDPGPGLPLLPPQRTANLTFLFSNDIPAVLRHTLDITPLQSTSTRIVPAGGRTSTEGAPFRCTDALATRLHTPLREFPGGHAGFMSHPAKFANRLREVIDEPA